MSHLPYFLLISLFLSLSTTTQAQFAWSGQPAPLEWGLQLGLSVQLGSHRTRAGLLAQGYVGWEYVQLNVHLGGYYQACALGSGAEGLEGQLRIGAVGAFGAREECWRTPFLSPVGQNLGRPASVGYALNLYWDNTHTSQMTGTLGFGGGPILLELENDYLVFKDKDRYRTGGLALIYQQGDFQLALQHFAWTADPYGEGTRTLHDKADQYPQARHGYRELSQQRYANRSAGVLALRGVYQTPWNTTVGAALGVDAEQIRHTIQNRWIHNVIDNPHIPMIDAEGKAYLFGDGQEVRTPRFFGEVLLNGSGGY